MSLQRFCCDCYSSAIEEIEGNTSPEQKAHNISTPVLMYRYISLVMFYCISIFTCVVCFFTAFHKTGYVVMEPLVCCDEREPLVFCDEGEQYQIESS